MTNLVPSHDVPPARSGRIFDVVFVVSPKNRGWILDAVCHEVARYFPGTSAVHYGLTPLLPARAYFFSHWALFVECIRRDPALRTVRSLVFFTHPPTLGRFRLKRFIRSLNRATKIVSMSTLHAEALVRAGLAEDRIEIIVPGADSRLFRSHRRTPAGVVGLCSAYYPRKAPRRIVEIARRMPHRPFLLLGRHWLGTTEGQALQRLQNFTYVEAPYEEYPRYYDMMTVFLSPSLLEGGPIPLLEAMMSNVVPVATRTGFAPDLIDHGVNGFLYEPSADVSVTCELIERAFGVKTDVRSTVEHLTWERYAQEVQALL